MPRRPAESVVPLTRVQRIEVRHFFHAPVQAVWDRYTDHAGWTDWAGLGTARLTREGVPAPNGVGCVRAFSRAGITAVHEEVTGFDPPRRMAYRIVKGGGPIKHHQGEVVFEPQADGTLLTWRVQFRAGIPGLGGILRATIEGMFRRALARLDDHLRNG